MMFAMFFLAEFSNMMLVSAVAATVFLGGWLVPFMDVPTEPNLLYTLLGCIVFFLKMYFLILVMMWIRWTFPRVRPDHLMNLGWKFLLPMAFVNLLVCAVVGMMDASEMLSWWKVVLVGVVSLVLVLAGFSLFTRHEQTPSPSAIVPETEPAA